MTFRILTVCIGNVCRSPVAERLLRLHLGEAVRSGHAQVDSAGVGAMVGYGVHELALAELGRLGGSGDGFLARQLAKDHVSQADLVLAATVDVRTKALREDPRAMKRTFTVAEFAAICQASWSADIASAPELVAFAATNRALTAGTDLDLEDPMGRSEAVHRAVADQIDGHVRRIAGRLGPLLSSSDAP